MLALGQGDGCGEVMVGLVQVSSQELHAALHAQRVGLPTRVTCLPRQTSGQVEQGDGLRVVRSVAVDRAQVRRGLGHHDRRSVRQVHRLAEPQLGSVVAGTQEVHVAELCTGQRRADRIDILDGQTVSLVQVRQTFLVEAAKRMDQRLGQHLSGPRAKRRACGRRRRAGRRCAGLRPLARWPRPQSSPNPTRWPPRSWRWSARRHVRVDAPAWRPRSSLREPRRAPSRAGLSTRRTGGLPPRRRPSDGRAGSGAPGGSRRAGSSRRRGRRSRRPDRARLAPSDPGQPRAGSPRKPQRPVAARRAATTRTRVPPGRPARRAARRRGRRPRSAPPHSRLSTSTSMTTSSESRSTTGSPSIEALSPRQRRISARLQRRARSGSSASENNNPASWLLVGLPSTSRR